MDSVPRVIAGVPRVCDEQSPRPAQRDRRARGGGGSCAEAGRATRPRTYTPASRRAISGCAPGVLRVCSGCAP
eukprot:3840931-Prymnesium_polylepis.1